MTKHKKIGGDGQAFKDLSVDCFACLQAAVCSTIIEKPHALNILVLLAGVQMQCTQSLIRPVHHMKSSAAGVRVAFSLN
jgi:hypothetical protein